MKSKANRRFWEAFRQLPGEVQDRAREAYSRFRDDPQHPGLQFKRVDAEQPIYSVRITRDYRALGVLRGDTITWFWIGNHAQYDRLLSAR